MDKPWFHFSVGVETLEEVWATWSSGCRAEVGGPWDLLSWCPAQGPKVLSSLTGWCAGQHLPTSRVVMATDPDDRLMNTSQKIGNNWGPRINKPGNQNNCLGAGLEALQHLWRVLNWDPGLWFGLGQLGKDSQVHNSFTALQRSLFSPQSTLGCVVSKSYKWLLQSKKAFTQAEKIEQYHFIFVNQKKQLRKHKL